MSGICGLVDFSGRPVATEELLQIAEAARHRGPDGIRYRARGAAAFCHLALDATAEAACEQQPLCTPDGAVWLVADLRLDNRKDLLRALEPSGFLPPGRTAGDGEILLAAFLVWGESCVDRLLGDFAFAIWDGRSRTVLCARDPLGVKPLCYARIGSLFCFASEAQQILRHPAVDRSFDEQSVADHLAGCSQDTGRSFFRQISRLPPGHRLTAAVDGDCLERTWAPEWIEEERKLSGEEGALHFREVFEEAVRARLRTQGRIGIALSGGLDSPSIAAVAQRHLRVSQSPMLLSYSFAFDSLKECDERPYIKTLAEAEGFETTFIPAEESWLLAAEDFDRVSLESPYQGWLSCHLKGMQSLTDRGARVFLSGHGADDLLHGSPLTVSERLLSGNLKAIAEVWRYAQLRGLYRLLISPLLPRRLDLSLRRLTRRRLPPQVPDWMDSSFVRATGVAERLEKPRNGHWQGMAQRACRTHLGLAHYEQTILWQDRITAAFGIEARHPFLDRRLAELVLAMPPGQLFKLDCPKSLLRRAMAGILPEPLRLRRQKTTFGSFMDISLREKAAHKIATLLSSPLIADLGMVDGSKLRSAFTAYRYGQPNPDSRRIWFAITLELWLRRHLTAPGLGKDPLTIQSAITSISC
jgi:asparagine synthase (glutamine-hydrolysing)